jgi:hypothetical protein
MASRRPLAQDDDVRQVREQVARLTAIIEQQQRQIEQQVGVRTIIERQEARIEQQQR